MVFCVIVDFIFYSTIVIAMPGTCNFNLIPYIRVLAEHNSETTDQYVQCIFNQKKISLTN